MAATVSDEAIRAEARLWSSVFQTPANDGFSDTTMDDEDAWQQLFVIVYADPVICATLATRVGLCPTGNVAADILRWIQCVPCMGIPPDVMNLQAYGGQAKRWLQTMEAKKFVDRLRSSSVAPGVKPRAYDSSAMFHGAQATPEEQAAALVGPEAAAIGELTAGEPTKEKAAQLRALLTGTKEGLRSKNQLVIARGVVSHLASKKKSSDKADKEDSAERLWNDMISRIQVFIAGFGYQLLKECCSDLEDGIRRVTPGDADGASKLVWQLDVAVFDKELWRFSKYREIVKEEMSAKQMLTRTSDFEDAIVTACKMVEATWGEFTGRGLARALMVWMKQYDRLNRDCTSWEGGWYGIYEQIPLEIMKDMFEGLKGYLRGGDAPEQTWVMSLTADTMQRDHKGLQHLYARNVQWLIPQVRRNNVSARDLASPTALSDRMAGGRRSESEPFVTSRVREHKGGPGTGIECYKCGGPHRKADCPLRAGKKRPGGEQQQQEREKGDRGKGKCFNCQEPGHESKDCPHEQACHQFVKNGNCRFGDDCKFAHPGAGGGRPRKREATEQDGRTREKRALPRSVQAMMKATAKIIALMENVGDEKKSFCLHRTLTGACKFDDAECSKVTGRSTLHALKEQCAGKVLDKFAETNEAKELLGTEGACFGLRKLAMKHVPDVIKLVDRQ